MTPPNALEDLDAKLRRVDPDRWLSSRFVADPAALAALTALYSFDYELGRATAVTRDAMMGEIRLTWWREAMEELSGGRPARRHPVVEALASSGLAFDALADVAHARLADLDPAPTGQAQTLAYVDATAGAVMMLAARRLDAAADPHAVKGAARAYGLALLATGEAGADIKDWGAQALAEAGAKPLPVAAFPAVAHAALARPYLAGRRPGELEKRLRLTWATATGRL